MNKTEYVAAVAEASGMTKVQAGLAVDAALAVITETLKKRFCKDMNLNIKIYEEPYFSNLLELYDKQFDTIDKYRQFVELVNFYGGEGEYFAAYDELKDKAITYLNDNESMLFFSREENMNKFKCVNEGYKSTDIFETPNEVLSVVKIAYLLVIVIFVETTGSFVLRASLTT